MNFAPTPLHFLEKDERGNRFYLKREDLLPYSFGGNKVRIGLSYLEDFRAVGATRMIAYGNPRSNLCRVLANLCAMEGIPLTVLSPADEDGSRADSFNSRMSCFLGAEILPCLKTGVAQAVQRALEDSRARGEIPYYIYGDITGKGREQVAAKPYVEVYREILSQEAALGVHFDRIVVSLGTGMTLGGLLAGATLAEPGEKRKLLGISIAREEENARSHVLSYAASCLGGRNPEEGLLEISDFFRGQYGLWGEEEARAIREMLKSHGIPLDPTYTGKGWWGLKELSRGWENQTLLFLHTGGTPLFFDALGEGLLHE